ncbi:MAG: excinuclease ABC subunit UvrC [Oscillospiraceae bacterium]|nr:excinuclease ABC subunit UvrC [Oscillospiraceae bacterium]
MILNPEIEFLRGKSAKLPLTPGVYLMKDKKGKIIYVGKAKQLKNRVSSYFADLSKRDRKTERLVERIRDFDYIVTPKEIDAFVLETSLIKQHRPKYNILLKDAKGFNYVKITAGAYPRLQYVLNAEDKSARYLGPYVGGFFVKQSVEDANRIFMLPSCNLKFPSENAQPKRACLNYRIKRCMGVCQGGVSEEEYSEIIKSAVNYIKNGSKSSIAALTKEMESAAEKLEFEKAAKIRDRIAAMKRADTVQSVISSKTSDYDVIAIAYSDTLAAAAVVKYSGGRLTDKQTFYLGDGHDESGHLNLMSDFLREYYSDSDCKPREIYIDIELEIEEKIEEKIEDKTEDKALLQEYLELKIVTPKRGEGLSQVMLAKNNAAEFLALKAGRKSKESTAVEELAKLLGLSKTPEFIECYDISNIGESVKVGGMVVYRNGKPFKRAYRRFTVKEVSGTDDYASMREVIRRRFARYAESGGDDGDDFATLPGLILLDGGAGHVSTVKSLLEELGLDIPLFGLVKDTRHKTRAVAASGGEIEIRSNKSVFTFLTGIQEEVHRFTVTFAREKHKKNSFTLSLTRLPGIGEKKAEALLKRFKTKQALKEATQEQIGEAAKINPEKAAELHKFISENF